jgi:hypothetical protein
MTVKNLSFWGWVKLTLILDYLILILMIPIVLIVDVFAPDKLTFNMPDKLTVYGWTLAPSGDMMVSSILFTGFIMAIIGLMIKSGVLYLLAQKTPLGRINIGK